MFNVQCSMFNGQVVSPWNIQHSTFNIQHHIRYLREVYSRNKPVGKKERNAGAFWARYDEQEVDDLLNDICKKVRSRQMPLASYLRLHAEAQLSDADIQTVCDWAPAGSRRRASTYTPP